MGMTYEQAVGIVGLCGAAAFGLSFVVHRFLQVELRARHHEVGGLLFLQLGVLFAVLLAFVFDEAFSQFNEAEQAVYLECGALHSVAMTASTLPTPVARAMLQAEAVYLEAVVRREWPELRRHRVSHGITPLMTDLAQQAARLALGPGLDGPTKGSLLAPLNEAHAQREARLYQADSGLPVALWVVLILYGVVLAGFVTLSGVSWLGSLGAFSAIFAVCTSAILVLVGLLNYPFEGALSIGPGDFVDTLGKVQALLQGLS
jgi:hypothetical protein